MRHLQETLESPTQITFESIKKTTFLIQTGIGLTNGLLLSIWGPFYYDSLAESSGAAMALTVTMILFAFRQGLVALLEVPTGALADTIGRGHTVILSLITRAALFLSLAAMVFTHSLVWQILWASFASFCYAFGYTLFNGAFSAWVADHLREVAPDKPYAILSSRYGYYQSVGEVFGYLISILLYLKHLPFVAFSIGALCAYTMMGYAMSRMREPLIIRKNLCIQKSLINKYKDMAARISNSAGLVRGKPVILWLVMVYGSYMFLTSLVCYLWPVYLRANETVHNIGKNWLFTAMVTEIMYFFGARLFVFSNDRLIRKNHGSLRRFAAYRWAMATTAAISAMSILLLAYYAYIGSVSLLMLVCVVSIVLFCAGWVMSCFDILVNSFIPVERAQDRSTILSSGSMFRSILTLLLAIPAGGMSAKESPVGWAIPASLLLISTVISFVLLKLDENKRISNSHLEVVSEIA